MLNISQLLQSLAAKTDLIKKIDKYIHCVKKQTLNYLFSSNLLKTQNLLREVSQSVKFPNFDFYILG